MAEPANPACNSCLGQWSPKKKSLLAEFQRECFRRLIHAVQVTGCLQRLNEYVCTHDYGRPGKLLVIKKKKCRLECASKVEAACVCPGDTPTLTPTVKDMRRWGTRLNWNNVWVSRGKVRNFSWSSDLVQILAAWFFFNYYYENCCFLGDFRFSGSRKLLLKANLCQASQRKLLFNNCVGELFKSSSTVGIHWLISSII